MTSRLKNILVTVLLLILAVSVGADEIGKASLTVLSVEDSTPTHSAPQSISFRPSFTPRSFSITPHNRQSISDIAFTTSLISLTALNIADYFSTRRALKFPGLSEGHPFMAPFVKNELLLTGFKFGITALDYFLIRKIYKENKALGWVISAAANVVMGFIVSNNMRLINQARAKI